MTNIQRFKMLTTGIAATIVLFALPGMSLAKTMTRSDVKQIIVEEAHNSSVPPALALAVAKVESDFNPKALSTAGARGVMQIMPKTAKDEFGVEKDELWKARLNIQLGIDYLSKLHVQYGQRWDLALSHYNGGTLKGNGSNARPHSYTKKYVHLVQRWQQRYADQNKLWTVAFNDKNPEIRKWRASHIQNGEGLYANNSWRRSCRKASRNVVWREYDRFSRPFRKGFMHRNSHIRTSWRNIQLEKHVDIAGSDLHERRDLLAQTLDDFAAMPRFRRSRRVSRREG